MAPEQQVTAILIPCLDGWCGSLYLCRNSPYLIFTYALEVAQPEEYAERLDVVNTLNILEADELGCRIGLVNPEPC